MSQIDATTADSLRTKMMAFADSLTEAELELFARVIIEAGPEVSGYGDLQAHPQIFQSLNSAISEVMKNFRDAMRQASRD